MPGITLKEVEDVMDTTKADCKKVEEVLEETGGDEAKAISELTGKKVEEEDANDTDAKAEAKADEPKAKPAKADEPKAKKVKADEPKAEAKADEPKEEAKADEPKAESKADEPEAEAKADEPEAEAKAGEPKEEAKADEPKAESKADEATAAGTKSGAQGDAKAHADDIVARIKELVKKGNVDRIEVKHKDQVLLSIPVNVGIVGSVIGIAAAPWAMLAAAIAAYGFACKVNIIKKDGSKEDIK